jgi:hypothetical protein
MPDSPELLTVAEVAALMRTTPDSVRDRVKRGTIPAECVVDEIKPMLFRAVALRAWLGLVAAQADASADASAERGGA